MTNNKLPEISLVIPVYNEIENLHELCGRVYKTMQKVGRSFEIIYVDDGSKDGSAEYLAKEEKRHPEIQLMSFVRNFGQNAAQLAGAYHARGQKIITIDADLQAPPEEIPKIVSKMDEGYDVVLGRRIDRQDSLLRRIPSYFIKKIGKRITKGELYDFGCGLRGYSRETIEMLKQYEGNLKVAFLISYLGVSVAQVDVKHQAREKGTSKYGFFSLFRLALDLITSFTIVPVQMVSLIGIGSAFVGFLIAAWILYLRFTQVVAPNDFASAARGVTAVLFFLFGILMLSVGVIGEYIARMFIEVQKRPLYILKKKKENSVDGDNN